MKRILLSMAALVGFTATTLATRPAAADVGDEAQEAQEVHAPIVVDEAKPTPPPLPGLGRKQDFWRFGLGVRVGYVSDPGFDPFAKQDTLPQWSLEAQKTLLVRGRLSLSAGVGWDIGGRSGRNARGSDASLLAHRLDVPIEARYHIFPWLYGFGKVAPGANYLSMRINDPSATSTLVANGWAFSTDVSAGASFLIGPHRHPEARTPRLWATPEFGYAWSSAVPLAFRPEAAKDDPRPVGDTNLGALALRGPFFRIGVAMSF